MTPTEEILKAYEQTNSIDGTQKATGFTLATIHAYLPRVRPAYGENQSENAKRIKMWREKTKKKYV